MSSTTCCTGDCNQGRDCPHRAGDAARNFALLIGILALFAVPLAWVGPTIDDNSAERAQADSLNDALKTESARLHRVERIHKQCGQNAGWTELGGGWVRCFDKHGHKTMVAQVGP